MGRAEATGLGIGGVDAAGSMGMSKTKTRTMVVGMSGFKESHFQSTKFKLDSPDEVGKSSLKRAGKPTWVTQRHRADVSYRARVPSLLAHLVQDLKVTLRSKATILFSLGWTWMPVQCQRDTWDALPKAKSEPLLPCLSG